MERNDNLIIKIKYGSHLYGTNTEKSDTDYKGIYMPNMEDMLLGKVKKSKSFNSKNHELGDKNSKNDVDEEIYSLQYFVDLACDGETVAFDMLYAPKSNCEFFSDEGKEVWFNIILNRHLFFTKNLKAFIGYCRKQASKYGVKGSRLSDAKKVIDCLFKFYSKSTKIQDIWDELPEGEHISKTIDNRGTKLYEVCGRKIQETVYLPYALNIVEKFYSSYGERARLAKENENIDWKAVSHAIRVAYEMKEIYQDGCIIFPLKESKFIKEVKEGKLDYTTVVAPKLEQLMEEVEKLSQESQYPEYADRKFWDDLVIKCVKAYYNI